MASDKEKVITYELHIEDMLRVFESDDLSEFYYYKDRGDWHLKLV